MLNKEKLFSIQVDRNLAGIKFEKAGKIEDAIKLYEANVKEGFEGTHPYDRLLVYFRKQKDYANELRVVDCVIRVYSELIRKGSPQIGIQDKLDKYLVRKNRIQQFINRI